MGTFGRGIYILDDYSPLRTKANALSDTHLFDVKDPWLYVVSDRYGVGEKGFQGADYYTAKNPPFGAVFTYRLKDELVSDKKARRKKEIELEKKGEDTPYPDWETVRQEDREEEPTVLLLVRDSDGNLVRQVEGKTGAGLHRTAWDLRWPATNPVNLSSPSFRVPWASDPQGPLVVPGQYSVTLAKREDGKLVELSEAKTFTVKSLPQSSETSTRPQEVVAFQRKAGELYRAVSASVKFSEEMSNRINHLLVAIPNTPGAKETEAQQLRAIKGKLDDVYRWRSTVTEQSAREMNQCLGQ